MHFHQLPGNAAAVAGLGIDFENHRSVPPSARERKVPPEQLHLQVTALATKRGSPWSHYQLPGDKADWPGWSKVSALGPQLWPDTELAVGVPCSSQGRGAEQTSRRECHET